MSIGSKIREARKAAKLTQVELAEKTRLSRSYIGDIEKDRYNPSLSTLELIAKATDMSLSALLHNENEEHPPTTTNNDLTALAPKMQHLKELRESDSLPALTPKESSHLQKYRALDDDGRALVDGLLDTLHEQRSSKFNTSSDETTAS